jgi:hypothetical protein
MKRRLTEIPSIVRQPNMPVNVDTTCTESGCSAGNWSVL